MEARRLNQETIQSNIPRTTERPALGLVDKSTDNSKKKSYCEELDPLEKSIRDLTANLQKTTDDESRARMENRINKLREITLKKINDLIKQHRDELAKSQDIQKKIQDQKAIRDLLARRKKTESDIRQTETKTVVEEIPALVNVKVSNHTDDSTHISATDIDARRRDQKMQSPENLLKPKTPPEFFQSRKDTETDKVIELSECNIESLNDIDKEAENNLISSIDEATRWLNNFKFDQSANTGHQEKLDAAINILAQISSSDLAHGIENKTARILARVVDVLMNLSSVQEYVHQLQEWHYGHHPEDRQNKTPVISEGQQAILDMLAHALKKNLPQFNKYNGTFSKPSPKAKAILPPIPPMESHSEKIVPEYEASVRTALKELNGLKFDSKKEEPERDIQSAMSLLAAINQTALRNALHENNPHAQIFIADIKKAIGSVYAYQREVGMWLAQKDETINPDSYSLLNEQQKQLLSTLENLVAYSINTYEAQPPNETQEESGLHRPKPKDIVRSLEKDDNGKITITFIQDLGHGYRRRIRLGPGGKLIEALYLNQNDLEIQQKLFDSMRPRSAQDIIAAKNKVTDSHENPQSLEEATINAFMYGKLQDEEIILVGAIGKILDASAQREYGLINKILEEIKNNIQRALSPGMEKYIQQLHTLSFGEIRYSAADAESLKSKNGMEAGPKSPQEMLKRAERVDHLISLSSNAKEDGDGGFISPARTWLESLPNEDFAYLYFDFTSDYMRHTYGPLEGNNRNYSEQIPFADVMLQRENMRRHREKIIGSEADSLLPAKLPELTVSLVEHAKIVKKQTEQPILAQYEKGFPVPQDPASWIPMLEKAAASIRELAHMAQNNDAPKDALISVQDWFKGHCHTLETTYTTAQQEYLRAQQTLASAGGIRRLFSKDARVAYTKAQQHVASSEQTLAVLEDAFARARMLLAEIDVLDIPLEHKITGEFTPEAAHNGLEQLLETLNIALSNSDKKKLHENERLIDAITTNQNRLHDKEYFLDVLRREARLMKHENKTTEPGYKVLVYVINALEAYSKATLQKKQIDRAATETRPLSTDMKQPQSLEDQSSEPKKPSFSEFQDVEQLNPRDPDTLRRVATMYTPDIITKAIDKKPPISYQMARSLIRKFSDILQANNNNLSPADEADFNDLFMSRQLLLEYIQPEIERRVAKKILPVSRTPHRKHGTPNADQKKRVTRPIQKSEPQQKPPSSTPPQKSPLSLMGQLDKERNRHIRA